MPRASRRRRILGVGAGLILAGSCFAPAALSHGGQGLSPGQAKKLASGQTGGGHGRSNGLAPGPAKKLMGMGGGGKGVGGKRGGGRAAGGKAAGGKAAGGKAAGGNAKALAPGQAKKVTPGGNAAGNGKAGAGQSPPGQAKKSGATGGAASKAAALTSSPVAPGQAKKTSSPVAPAPAAAPAPAPPAATPVAAVTLATPTAPAPTPAPARPHRSRAHRSAATHRSSAGTIGTFARGSAGARAAAAAASRRLALATPATPAASASASARRRRSHGLSIGEPAGTQHGLSPISSIGNLLPVSLPVPDWSKPIILALLLICVLLGVRVWLGSRRAGRLESQRRRLTADLDSLQPALVPEIPSRFGQLAVSVAYRPADGPAAGGDFYDAFALEGGRVAVMVGDVSGHGRLALTRAAHMRYMLRAYVETGLDPRSALKLAGRVLGADEDALFTTVGIAVYDADTATLTYATAGHPAPVLLGPGAHDPVTSAASPALGWGAPTGRRQTTVPFSEGARACFFSDGVTELRTTDGLLGRQRLTELAAQTNPADAAPDLLAKVQREARLIRDDMAACIIEATAGTAISEHRVDELEVQPRHLENGQAERFLSECGVPPVEARSSLARAQEIAAEAGSAVLRVDVAGHSATVTVCRTSTVGLAIPSSLSPEFSDTRTGGRGRTTETPSGRPVTLG